MHSKSFKQDYIRGLFDIYFLQIDFILLLSYMKQHKQPKFTAKMWKKVDRLPWWYILFNPQPESSPTPPNALGIRYWDIIDLLSINGHK